MRDVHHVQGDDHVYENGEGGEWRQQAEDPGEAAAEFCERRTGLEGAGDGIAHPVHGVLNFRPAVLHESGAGNEPEDEQAGARAQSGRRVEEVAHGGLNLMGKEVASGQCVEMRAVSWGAEDPAWAEQGAVPWFG